MTSKNYWRHFANSATTIFETSMINNWPARLRNSNLPRSVRCFFWQTHGYQWREGVWYGKILILITDFVGKFGRFSKSFHHFANLGLTFSESENSTNAQTSMPYISSFTVLISPSNQYTTLLTVHLATSIYQKTYLCSTIIKSIYLIACQQLALLLISNILSLYSPFL